MERKNTRQKDEKRKNQSRRGGSTALRKWIAAALLIVLAVGSMPCGTARAKEADIGLYARGAVLMDADSGRVLYGREENVALPMASTTKIMTCILALELGNLEDEVEASAYAASQEAVHLKMRSGERFYLKDLLYSLMLESHNDTAVAIAEHIGGSVEAFAKLMNEKAKEIGCTNTHYITPNGLDATEIVDGVEMRHSITAKDLARVMRYCVMLSPKKEMFLEITQTANYSFANRQGSRSYSCTNRNAFLKMMDGMLSGKTGYTGGAGYCYVGALRRDDRTFIVALLASGWPNHSTYRWVDTRKLMEYGIQNYAYQNIYREVPLKPVTILNGAPAGDRFNPYAEVEVAVEIKEKGTGAAGEESAQAEAGAGENLPMSKELNFLLSPADEVRIDVSCVEKLEAPVKKGKKVGMIVYRINGEPVREYEVVLAEDVRRKDVIYIGRYILQEYLFKAG